MAELHNKLALVTGASRGIGRATASALAAAGAHVLVHYGRSAQDAESLVADIRSKEGRADDTRGLRRWNHVVRLDRYKEWSSACP